MKGTTVSFRTLGVFRGSGRSPALLVVLYLGAIALFGLAARPARHADLAVVFGSRVGSPRLAARLGVALSLYRAGTVARIVVSGGIEPDGADEARFMSAWLEKRGVPARSIALDDRGDTTWATARNIAALVPRPDGVVVVTQWFHIPRAELALYRVGIPHVSGAWPRFSAPRDVWSLLREAVAIPYYAFRPLSAAARR